MSYILAGLGYTGIEVQGCGHMLLRLVGFLEQLEEINENESHGQQYG